MLRRSIALGSVLAAFGLASFSTTAMLGDDRIRIEARMTAGNDLEQADAKYEERPRNGVINQRFSVEVEDFAPGAVLEVAVEGAIVGTITVNDFGMGELQLRSRVDDPGDGTPIQGDFPFLRAGDSVTVGPLSGIFQDK